VNLKSAFDQAASRYDQTRRQLIPCFDLFYGTAVELIPVEAQRVLDLGAGTGLLSSLVLAHCPSAAITLADISTEMLEQAKTRLSPAGGRCTFLAMDYQAELPSGNFDAIVSALSIHHLDATAKRSLFDKIFQHLSPGGIFVNADQVVGETPAIDSRYCATWVGAVRESGIDPAAMWAAFERTKLDRMSPLSPQLDWLREIGFTEVSCWFQHYSFVVFSGKKRTLTGAGNLA
jgi:tRNA (cmo5U34)-methyltransferase